MNFGTFQKHLPFTLNKQQDAAARSVEGPILLLAVPGSGKTTTLVTRLGYMVKNGIAESSILVLTYTVAATKDMKARYESLFGETNIEFRTINGLCAKFLMIVARNRGLTLYNLIEAGPQKAIIREVFKKIMDERGETKWLTETDMTTILTHIAYIKNMMLDDDTIEREYEDKDGLPIAEIFYRYEEKKDDMRVMDYDDQLVNAYNLLSSDEPTLRYFQSMYTYICVDEAQDTSKIQHEIIRLLSVVKDMKGSVIRDNLFMVGDEDQSIYGFRAAYPEALVNFEKVHANAKVLLMETNFRSTRPLVDHAQRFIESNKLRHKKVMKAIREDEGKKPGIIKTNGRTGQFNYLAKVFPSVTTQTAVLYRDNESALPLIDSLDKAGIPYNLKKAEGSGFFVSRQFQDIWNFLLLIQNPESTGAFLKIYMKMGIPIRKADAELIASKAASKKIKIIDAIQYVKTMPERTATALRGSLRKLGFAAKKDGREAINVILDAGYSAYMQREKMSDAKIGILKVIGSRYQLPEFMQRMNELMELVERGSYDKNALITLSTIHSSKGLEWSTVYMVDVADGIFPATIPKDLSKKEVREAWEEERRLFYVGVTRPKDSLFLFSKGSDETFISQYIGSSTTEKPSAKVAKPVSVATPKSKAKPSPIGGGSWYQNYCKTYAKTLKNQQD